MKGMGLSWLAAGRRKVVVGQGEATILAGEKAEGCGVLALFVAERKGKAEKKMKTGGGWFGWPVFGSEKSNRGAAPGDKNENQRGAAGVKERVFSGLGFLYFFF